MRHYRDKIVTGSAPTMVNPMWVIVQTINRITRGVLVPYF